MIKYINILLLTALLPMGANAQNIPNDSKRGNIWKLGYSASETDTLLWGINTMNFNTTPVQITKKNHLQELYGANTSICNTAGRLLFYSNNMFVYDKFGQRMQGGDSLNPILPNTIESFYYTQPVVALPLPNSDSLYYIFHQRALDGFDDPAGTFDLFYTIVDMSQNNSLGRIVSFRNRFSDGNLLAHHQIVACRHANGRDWWLSMWNIERSKYRRILLDPTGVHDLGWEQVDVAQFLGLGQAMFSPDGSKYVQTSYSRNTVPTSFPRIDIYNFDRCTGSMARAIPPFYLQDSAINYLMIAGCSISPNSRYLYITTALGFYQYDLQAADIPASRVVIGVYDGFKDTFILPGFVTGPWLHQLAPDGKIYMSTGAGTHYLHTISAPDIGGIACGLQQHSVQLPAYNFRSLPNLPYFRLGALAGSGCDTLGLSVGTSRSVTIREGTVRIFPNPANDYFTIETERIKGTAYLYNALGQLVKQVAINDARTLFNTNHIPNGIYFLSVNTLAADGTQSNAFLGGIGGDATKIIVQHP